MCSSLYGTIATTVLEECLDGFLTSLVPRLLPSLVQHVTNIVGEEPGNEAIPDIAGISVHLI